MRGKCPAYGQQCRKCKRKNHFAKCCFGRVNMVERSGYQESWEKCKESSSSSEEEFFIETVVIKLDKASKLNVVNKKSDMITHTICGISQWTLDMITNVTNVTYKLDTGAQVNILPKSIYEKLNPRPKLKQAGIKLAAYNNSDIPVEGKCISSVH